MALVRELFDRGIVTSRTPTLLRPGELQQADDCVYRLFDPAIYSTPGRTEYNSIALGSPSAIKGLAHLTFDGNKTDQLVALVDDDLYTGDYTGDTGSLSAVTGPGVVTDAVTSFGVATVTSASGGFANMVVGAPLIGSGIPVGTRVLTVDSSTQITMTANATASATITLIALLGIPVPMPNEGTETLDVVQWSSLYYLLVPGKRPTRLWWVARSPVNAGTNLNPILAGRVAGLEPVTVFGRGTTAGDTSGPDVVAGVWNANLGAGTYWFLITEAINVGEVDEIEGTYTVGVTPTDPKSKLIVRSATITTPASQAIRITFPTAVNTAANGKNQATHWIVYMSDKTVNVSEFPSLATFKRAAVVPITDTTVTIGDNSVQYGPNLPTTVAAGANGRPRFTNDTRLTALDGTMAGAASGPTITTTAETLMGSFGLGAVTGTVRGIQIEVYGQAKTSLDGLGFYDLSGAGDYYVEIIAGTKRVTRFGRFVGEYRQGQIFGGRTDTLGISWTDTDFDDGTLTVLIGKTSTNPEKQFLEIDAVRVAVFTGTELIKDGQYFPVVTYRSQIGTTVNDPAALPPPNATTGDVFQGQLVTNDQSDDSVIRYSLPGYPEYFPKPYFMKMSGKKKDIVTIIRRVGQILVVGMRDTMKRVNYLARETDADNSEGLAHEDLASDHGCVGPMAGTLVDLPGRGLVLAYVSHNGLRATDGINTWFLNIDLKWSTLIKTSALSTCILRNYPKENWLVLFYCPSGSTHSQNTRAMVFSYDPTRTKEGSTLPAVGPFKVAARSAAEANVSGDFRLLTGHQTLGKIYVEDSGLTLPASYTVANAAGTQAAVDVVPTILTRRVYPAGMERVAREERVYVEHDSCGSTFTVASSATTIDSATVTSSAGFGSVTTGMYVTGTGIKPGTVVITKTNSSNITLSQTAEATGTVTLTFSSGTLGAVTRGYDLGETIADIETAYLPMHTGGLLVFHLDNARQALEFEFSRVILPSGTGVALSPQMRLHTFGFLAADGGQELNVASY